jgi:hypothetical protein
MPTTIPSSFSIPISEKLTKANYRLWRAQILPPIRVAQMEDLLLGVEKKPAKTLAAQTGVSSTERPNPDYYAWLARDQALLGYLLLSLSRDVLMGVTIAATSAEAWHTLEGMYASPTCARTVNIRIALATMKKGTATMAEYYSKMKIYAYDMASFGQPLCDEEFVAYVLTAMDEECYKPLVSSVVARAEPISPPKLYSQMLSYEHRVDLQSSDNSQFSVNAATCGRGTPWAPRSASSPGRGRGHSCGSGRVNSSLTPHGGLSNNNNFRRGLATDAAGGQNRPQC